MDGKTRAGMTVFIWLALLTALTTILTVADTLDNGVTFMLVGASMFALLFSTGFLWNWGRLPFTGDLQPTARERAKDKRPDRVNAVLNALTDDELDALRQRLSQRDETVSLANLLDEEGELRR